MATKRNIQFMANMFRNKYAEECSEKAAQRFAKNLKSTVVQDKTNCQTVVYTEEIIKENIDSLIEAEKHKYGW